jgi:hypothetical protein
MVAAAIGSPAMRVAADLKRREKMKPEPER